MRHAKPGKTGGELSALPSDWLTSILTESLKDDEFKREWAESEADYEVTKRAIYNELNAHKRK